MKNNKASIINYLKFDRVVKCSKELDRIAKAKTPSERKILLSNAKDCVIDAISEIAKNCLSGNIPLSLCDFKNLEKYKKVLRFLSSQTPINKRRKICASPQTGGFLPFLIPPALSLLATVLGNYINKKYIK